MSEIVKQIKETVKEGVKTAVKETATGLFRETGKAILGSASSSKSSDKKDKSTNPKKIN